MGANNLLRGSHVKNVVSGHTYLRASSNALKGSSTIAAAMLPQVTPRQCWKDMRSRRRPHNNREAHKRAWRGGAAIFLHSGSAAPPRAQQGHMVSNIFATHAEHADVKASRRLSGCLVQAQQLGRMPDDGLVAPHAYTRHKGPPTVWPQAAQM